MKDKRRKVKASEMEVSAIEREREREREREKERICFFQFGFAGLMPYGHAVGHDLRRA